MWTITVQEFSAGNGWLLLTDKITPWGLSVVSYVSSFVSPPLSFESTGVSQLSLLYGMNMSNALHDIVKMATKLVNIPPRVSKPVHC